MREMWNGLKQRLGLKRMGCCAATTWSPDASPMATRESTAEDDRDHDRTTVTIGQVLGCDGARQLQGMNLAAALEAERNSRRGGAGAGGVTTLMRLIEETDGVDLMMKRRRERRKAAAEGGGGGTGGGCDWSCCVCMERDKGAAFIPCGHAFCRECSRELWLGRGYCPICNRSIVEILDLF